MSPSQPTQIDEALTRRIAELSKLELTGEEAALFTTQLRQILGYVEQLNEVITEGVEPMTHPLELATPLREDIARPSPVDEHGRPKMLKPAPEVEEDGFQVPPIL
jgi:aspartyl-tRNA(Asn)/glutamyl-tRNA(Gln) amidotransferase subunit C